MGRWAHRPPKEMQWKCIRNLEEREIHTVKCLVLDDDQYSASNSDAVSLLRDQNEPSEHGCMDPRAGLPKTVIGGTSISTSNETLAI
jgi:hypothetical protein